MQATKQLATLWLAICLISLTGLVHAAPKAKLWDRWAAHNPVSDRAIDHSAWDAWLKRFVVRADDGINRVAYAAVDAGDREQLKNYIEELTQLSISDYPRAEQKAYWINLYNALTVNVVLDHYPVQSIRDIKAGFFSSGPWKLKLVTIEDEAVSLDDIEHRILRPIWQDPRIHYAVNCASLGCPNLQSEAFTSKNREQLLNRAAREFVNHPRGANVVDGRLEVSSIYDWFAQDFGGNDRAVIEHLKRYADDKLASQLSTINRISDNDYNWNINAGMTP
jgi:hypothetical protein